MNPPRNEDIYTLENIWDNYDLEHLYAFEILTFEHRSIREYLLEDDNNIVIVAVVNNRTNALATYKEGPGGLLDTDNAKYFVRCISNEDALSSDTTTTHFKNWYYKVFGENFNFLIPLNELYHIISNMNSNINSRILFALETPNMFANSSAIHSTLFFQNYDIFGDPITLVSGTHCNSREYFMKLRCSVSTVATARSALRLRRRGTRSISTPS